MTDAHRLDLLVSWADERGWHVELDTPTGEVDSADPFVRVVTIERGQTKRAQVYALLHELGHKLLWDAHDYLFSVGPMARIENELEAWRRGWRLAERLELSLPLNGYRREAAKWFATYVRDFAKAAA